MTSAESLEIYASLLYVAECMASTSQEMAVFEKKRIDELVARRKVFERLSKGRVL